MLPILQKKLDILSQNIGTEHYFLLRNEIFMFPHNRSFALYPNGVSHKEPPPFFPRFFFPA